MRILALGFLLLSLTSGCATLRLIDGLEYDFPSGYHKGSWRRCQVAEDKNGRLRYLLTMELEGDEQRRFGDVAWFDANPQAPLLLVAKSDSSRWPHFTNALRLADERGELSGELPITEALAELKRRVIVRTDHTDLGRFEVVLHRPSADGRWPQVRPVETCKCKVDRHITIDLGPPTEQREEDFGYNPWPSALYKTGLSFLLPVTLTLDAAFGPLVYLEPVFRMTYNQVLGWTSSDDFDDLAPPPT